MSLRDELLIKSRLLADGVRIDGAALDGVGEQHKEQLHHLFEYDFDAHPTRAYPAELRLAGGSVVQVRLNHRAAIGVERRDDALILVESGRELASVEWLARPAFYARTTGSGIPMSTVAEMVGEDCVSICHTNACLTFSDGGQCAFCNLNHTPRQYEEVVIRKEAVEVGEVVAAAVDEAGARHFTITGGILPGDHEIRILEAYLEAIREACGSTVPAGTTVMTPPEDLRDLEKLRELGLQGVGFNLECFDAAFFAAVCPGKEKRIGYERYREALRAAVEIFGAGGRVFSGFVAGIEPKEFLLEGVQELAEEGVASIPLVWSPSSETRFHGHRPPEAEWYLELSERTAALLVRHMKREPGAPPPVPTRCRRCQNQCLLHDVLESRLRMLKSAATSEAADTAPA